VPKAYSSDLRVRVIEAVVAGASRREAAERFEVSIASAVKWLQRWRDDNSAAPKPSGGSVSPLEEFAAEILAVVAEHSDLTLEETVQSCASSGFEPAAARSGVFSIATTSPLKKPCKLPNGSEQMWRAHAGVGYESKVFLIPPGWCLSTRLRSARTWRD